MHLYHENTNALYIFVQLYILNSITNRYTADYWSVYLRSGMVPRGISSFEMITNDCK